MERFLGGNNPPRVKPITEMSFRNALASANKGISLETNGKPYLNGGLLGQSRIGWAVAKPTTGRDTPEGFNSRTVELMTHSN
jgi:hypothetical protein